MTKAAPNSMGHRARAHGEDVTMVVMSTTEIETEIEIEIATEGENEVATKTETGIEIEVEMVKESALRRVITARGTTTESAHRRRAFRFTVKHE